MKKTIKITTALFILLFSILGMTSDAKAALLSVDNAKAFQSYILDPVSLATYCPSTYQFIAAATAMY